MKIKISPNIFKYYPNIQYTVIVIHNIENQRKISNLSQLLRGTAVVTKNDYKKVNKKDLISQISDIRLEDGSTFLESYLFDSRIKKIMNGKDLDANNNLLNLISLLSLKFTLPIFGTDLDQEFKDIVIDFYLPKKGKKSPDLNFLSSTKSIAIWFPNLSNINEEQIDFYISEINLILYKYLNTQISEVYHLDNNTPEIDLKYQSDMEQEYLEGRSDHIIANFSEDSALNENSINNIESNIQTITDNNLTTSVPTQINQEDKETTTTIHPQAKMPLESLKQSLNNILNNIFPSVLSLISTEELQNNFINIEAPKDSSHGDFSTNLAMKLAKNLSQNPVEIANQIKNELSKDDRLVTFIEKIEVIPPGFINFYLNTNYFVQNLNQILELKGDYGQQNIGNNQKIMIEFGSLNIAKPFGAHHFLTTIIGQTLVNLHKKIGFDVLSADHPGDWGTQFGKAIYAYKNWGNREEILKDPMNELLKLYVRFHEEAEANPQLEDLAREEFKKLEDGDSENLELWKWIVEISLKDLDVIYQTLGVKFDRRYGEAKYNQACQLLLQKGKDLGVFIPGENNAYIVDLEDQKLPPALVQKGDGTSLYLTRDLASIEDRLKTEENLKKLIYIVDNAQTLHFKQLFAIANKLHQADSNYPITEFKHIPYGRMSFADEKMSTRKGNVILGIDLIKEAQNRSAQIINQKLSKSEEKFTDNELKQLINGIALGAIKYSILAQAPESDFIFDWDKVLSFEGNSAPYLQYTYARSQSILRKFNQKNTENNTSNSQIDLFSYQEEKEQITDENSKSFDLDIEKELLRQLALYPEKLTSSALQYKPNILTTYLYQLAQTFNSFYGSTPILKTQNEELLNSRIKLVEATAEIIKNGLNLIGIQVFERM